MNNISRIMYLVEPDLRKPSGVMDKVRQQVAVWRGAAGVETYIVSVRDLAVEKDSEIDESTCISKAGNSYLEKILSYRSRCEQIAELVDLHAPDIVYTRYLFYTPALRRAYAKRKTIFEANSRDLQELWRRGYYSAYGYHLMTKGMMMTSVDGVVAVTQEILNEYNRKFNKPSVCIANGCAATEPPPALAESTARPRAAFVGSPGQPWHGAEKISEIAAGIPDWDFDVVGPAVSPAANVINHGFVDGDEVKRILGNARIGIGSLSFYENGMFEGCPLKTRQYLSMGLPIVYAYRDPDLEGTEEFTLRISNTRGNVVESIAEIRHFFDRVLREPELRMAAHSFSQRFLTYDRKETARPEFFSRIFEK